MDSVNFEIAFNEDVVETMFICLVVRFNAERTTGGMEVKEHVDAKTKHLIKVKDTIKLSRGMLRWRR